jgi:GNAT superfamily N-acetyltransferase
MSLESVELSPRDPDPSMRCEAGIDLISMSERQLHGADRTLLLTERDVLVARCSLWWTSTPRLDGRPVGVIGHYAATNADTAVALLARACDLLTSRGLSTAVGPMDGTTWRRYRFIVDRGDEPAFFLEPDNSDEWPGQWTRAGFVPLATYTSAINDGLSFEDPRTATAVNRLNEAGITLRAFDAARAQAELHEIFRLSLAAFRRNFLYTPIGEEEFVAQYRAVLPYVRPELVMLAENEGRLVGFIFALPDMLQARRGGRTDTVILKTVAVDPAVAGMGLGGVLMDLVQREARDIGFRRAIHALIHEDNVSRRISDRSARTIRRYALFSKDLAPAFAGGRP